MNNQTIDEYFNQPCWQMMHVGAVSGNLFDLICEVYATKYPDEHTRTSMRTGNPIVDEIKLAKKIIQAIEEGLIK